MALPEQHSEDPYLDPGTGLLRNKANITDPATLASFETARAEVRALQLAEHPLPITGGLPDLQAIHQHLFQDVYEWAGQLRTVDLEKAGEHFMNRYHLERAAQYVFDELHQDSFLQGMGPDRFADRLAHHYDQVNHLHPFREGNGRTQRVFWSQVAHQAGYDLNWTAVTGAVNDHASHTARVDRDLRPLREMFAQMATPHAQEPAHTKPRSTRSPVDMRKVQQQIEGLRQGSERTYRTGDDDRWTPSWRHDPGGRQP